MQSETSWQWLPEDSRTLLGCLFFCVCCALVAFSLLLCSSCFSSLRLRGVGDASSEEATPLVQRKEVLKGMRLACLLLLGFAPLINALVVGDTLINVVFVMISMHWACMVVLPALYYVTISGDPEEKLLVNSFYKGLWLRHKNMFCIKCFRGCLVGIIVFAIGISLYFLGRCDVEQWPLCFHGFQRPLNKYGFGKHSMSFRLVIGIYFIVWNPVAEEFFWRVFLHRELPEALGLKKETDEVCLCEVRNASQRHLCISITSACDESSTYWPCISSLENQSGKNLALISSLPRLEAAVSIKAKLDQEDSEEDFVLVGFAQRLRFSNRHLPMQASFWIHSAKKIESGCSATQQPHTDVVFESCALPGHFIGASDTGVLSLCSLSNSIGEHNCAWEVLVRNESPKSPDKLMSIANDDLSPVGASSLIEGQGYGKPPWRWIWSEVKNQFASLTSFTLSPQEATNWGVCVMYASYHMWPISVLFGKLWWLYAMMGFAFLVTLGRVLLLFRESSNFGLPASYCTHALVDAAFMMACLLDVN